MVRQWKLESSVMRTPIQPLTLLVVAIAGWIQRDQQAAIVYLLDGNRVVKALLCGRKLRLTDAERGRLDERTGKCHEQHVRGSIRAHEWFARPVLDELHHRLPACRASPD